MSLQLVVIAFISKGFIPIAAAGGSITGRSQSAAGANPLSLFSATANAPVWQYFHKSIHDCTSIDCMPELKSERPANAERH
jgi:hypothetical protein